MSVELGRNYANAVRNAHDIPVDAGESIEMKLPDFADHERIKSAQAFFRKNLFAMMFAMYMGLLSILAIPTILDVLVHTNKSSSDLTAYRRYMQTIYHTLTWFRSDLKPGTKAWRSLETVRKLHFHGSRSARNANVGMISQKDMAITQYGFMGFIVLSQKEVGVQGSKTEMEAFFHFWRVLGHVLGIKDEFNLCCETYDETIERFKSIQSDFIRPNLENPPENFTPMTKYIANGLWCFNPFDPYNETLFVAKRLSGVPNFHYFDNEIPANYDRSMLELYKLTRGERVVIWLSTMTRQFLLQCCILRWFFNFVTLINEFFIRYFPCLAFCKFGCRDAYVDINV